MSSISQYLGFGKPEAPEKLPTLASVRESFSKAIADLETITDSSEQKKKMNESVIEGLKVQNENHDRIIAESNAFRTNLCNLIGVNPSTN